MHDVSDVKLELTCVAGFHQQVGRSIVSDPDSEQVKGELINKYRGVSTSNFEPLVVDTANLLSVDMKKQNQRNIELHDVEGVSSAGNWGDSRLLFRLSFTIPTNQPNYVKVYTYSGWCDGELVTSQGKPAEDTIYVVNDISTVSMKRDTGFGGRIDNIKTNQLIMNKSGSHEDLLRPSDIIREEEITDVIGPNGKIIDMDGITNLCQLSDRTNQNNLGYSKRFMLSTLSAKHVNEQAGISTIRSDMAAIEDKLVDDPRMKNFLNNQESGETFCPEDSYNSDALVRLLSNAGISMNSINGGRFTHLHLYEVFGDAVLDRSTTVCYDSMGELTMERPDSISWDNSKSANEAENIILEIATTIRNGTVGMMHELRIAQTNFRYSNTGMARDMSAELYGGNNGNCIERLELASNGYANGVFLSSIMEDPNDDIIEAEVKLYRKFMMEIVPSITKKHNRNLTVDVMIDRSCEVCIEVAYDNYPKERVTGTLFSDALTTNMLTRDIDVKAGLTVDFSNIRDGLSDNEAMAQSGDSIVRGSSSRTRSNSQMTDLSIGNNKYDL